MQDGDEDRRPDVRRDVADVGGDSSDNEAAEQGSSPKKHYVRFAGPPSATKSAHKPKPGQPRPNKAEAAALAHATMVEGCQSPEQFVTKVVFGGLPGMFREWVDKSPAEDAPPATWAEFVRVRRAMSEASIAWWMKEVFGGALPIALSLVGAQHTGLTDQNYSADARVKRSFWFMCFIIAATEHENMGSQRDISFVKEVYRLTVEDFMMPGPGPGKELSGKHGRKNANQAAEVSSEFVTKSLAKQWRNKKEIERDEGPSFWDSVDSKQVCPLEKILEKRARENAGAQVTIAKNGDTCTILFDL